MKRILLSLIALMGVCIQQDAAAQQLAFPGAEGAGAYTTGGRGTPSVPTTVFEVTNLSDVNAPGSLRYAVTAAATYRTIVFRVSGTIHLTSKLNIKSNTTIAGQTAPGDGICIADHPVVISGDNVIVRYVRIRMGDRYQLKTNPTNCGVPTPPFTAACMPVDGSGGDDAFGNLGNKNIIIDHCSISWSSDEAMTFYRGDSLTLQWNIISEPLNYNYHYESPDTDFQQHGYGGIWGAQHATFHHNLIAHARNRTPRFAGNSTYPPGAIESADFRNNVIYNWGINNIYGGDGGQYNLVNNYFKYGPSTSSGVRYRIVTVDSSTSFPYAKYYLSGNYVDGSPANTQNNWSGTRMMSGIADDTVKSKVTTPFLAGYIPSVTHDALTAYDTVLKGAGAILPKRDTLDARIVKDVTLRQGKIIDVQGGFSHGTPYSQTVNAWPTLNASTAPADTDKDGMPDSWETDNALNPNDATDRAGIAPNGYTNLENYLNSIVATATTPTNPSATTPATATWTLASDQTPTVTGAVTASNQTIGTFLTGVSYGSTFAGITGWQRVGTTSSLPTAFTANSYVQYTVTPAAGKTFKATKIELSALGGGTGTAKMAVYYSLDDFATSQPAGTCTYGGGVTSASSTDPVSLLNTSTTPLTGQQIATIPTDIDVPAGQTLSVRVYVWMTGTGSRYFPSQQVKIEGNTSDVTMPVDLLGFAAESNGDRNRLLWTTANEHRLGYFEIQKSADGQVFTRIGSVNARNEVSASYQFVDAASTGISFYRLKMVNADGSFRYSPIITVSTRAAARLAIYPNPATASVNISYLQGGASQRLDLLSIEGRILRSVVLIPGSTQVTLPVTDLHNGVYLFRYTDGKNIETVKFLKN